MVQINVIVGLEVSVRCPFCQKVRTIVGWKGDKAHPCERCRNDLDRLRRIESGESVPR